MAFLPLDRSMETSDRVARDYAAIKLRAELGRALLGGVVDPGEAEALGVAAAPLEVVQQAPQEIAAHRCAVGDRALQLAEVLPQKHDAVDVQHATLGIRCRRA